MSKGIAENALVATYQPSLAGANAWDLVILNLIQDRSLQRLDAEKKTGSA
ncbi:MAG: hypothetical protein ACP5R5_02915 [Armatimonadota bacterium]